MNEATIYRSTPETTIHRTADSLLCATKRAANYIYEDLRELSGKATVATDYMSVRRQWQRDGQVRR